MIPVVVGSNPISHPSRVDAGALKPLPLVEGQRRRVPLYLIFAQPELAGPATRRLADVLRHAAKERIPAEVSQELPRQ